jgi:hypothetical protein
VIPFWELLIICETCTGVDAKLWTQLFRKASALSAPVCVDSGALIQARDFERAHVELRERAVEVGQDAESIISPSPTSNSSRD